MRIDGWRWIRPIITVACVAVACDSVHVEEASKRSQADEADSVREDRSQPMTTDPQSTGTVPTNTSDPGKVSVKDDGPIILPATVTATPRKGSLDDDTTPPRAGGLILMGGGTDVDSAFVWAQNQIARDKATRQGDALVLRATGTDGYDQYLYDLAPFHSVQTLIISPNASTADLDTVARLVNRSELVFFAGGNQADYVAWRNSKLMPAVQNVVTRGGVVGGTSAGLAILGQFVFDSVAAGSNNVATADAVADPFEPTISFTRNMLAFPVMKGIITDTHFAQRDRFGRLTSFMARQQADGVAGANGQITGLGVSEGTAILVDVQTGRGIRSPGSAGAAYLIRGGAPSRIVKGQSLLYSNLSVVRIDADNQYYDFIKSCGTGPAYVVSVDGSASSIYTPGSVYDVAGTPGTCP